MARTFITIDTTAADATQSVELKQWIGLLRQVYEIGGRIRAKMTNMNDSTVWTDLEIKYGLPTGEGQTIFDYVNGAVGSMQGDFQTADVKNITENVG